jgi:hypothetical protein
VWQVPYQLLLVEMGEQVLLHLFQAPLLLMLAVVVGLAITQLVLVEVAPAVQGVLVAVVLVAQLELMELQIQVVVGAVRMGLLAQLKVVMAVAVS